VAWGLGENRHAEFAGLELLGRFFPAEKICFFGGWWFALLQNVEDEFVCSPTPGVWRVLYGLQPHKHLSAVRFVANRIVSQGAFLSWYRGYRAVNHIAKPKPFEGVIVSEIRK